MRRFYSAVFILLFVFQMVGFQLVFEAKKYSIRKEIRDQIRQGLPEDQLTLFKIPLYQDHSFRKNFLFFEENEFRHNGVIYDLVKTRKEDNFILYYGIADFAETSLFSTLDTTVRKTMNTTEDGKNQMHHINQLISQIFMVEKNSYLFYLSKIEELVWNYSFSEQSWSLNPETPPPTI